MKYYLKAVNAHKDIDDLAVLLRVKLAEANIVQRLTLQRNSSAIEWMEEAVSMAERIYPRLEITRYTDFRFYEIRRDPSTKIIIPQPWTLSRHRFASIIDELASLKRYTQDDSLEDRIALWEKAVRIDPYSHYSLDSLPTDMPPDQRYGKLAEAYRRISSTRSLENPSLSLLTEHLLFKLEAGDSSLSLAHEALSIMGGSREFSYGYLEEILKIIKTREDIQSLASAELELGDIYAADGNIEKATEYYKSLLGRYIFRARNVSYVFHRKLELPESALGLVIIRLAQAYSSLIWDPDTSEASETRYVEKLKLLDGFTSIFDAASTDAWLFYRLEPEAALGPNWALLSITQFDHLGHIILEKMR
ncbi:hypothetical protein AA313_de0202042 [Arthrobotrys entomopaga]|nr:hypothetical protein AA313_de0202042 [Arthrobotrys entomopaga]